jgi:hypothetical protein
MIAGAADNVFNLRTHHFGIDAEDLSLLQTTAVRNATRIPKGSEAELSRVGPNTFFRDANGILMIVTDVTGAHCQCREKY